MERHNAVPEHVASMVVDVADVGLEGFHGVRALVALDNDLANVPDVHYGKTATLSSKI